MRSDSSARLKALDPTKSFIVQAPAGSGKTALLTQRFLKCLSCVERAPEEILAVTFTRKAALEMRQRIIEALESANQHPEPPDTPHERTTLELARAALKRDAEENWQLMTHVHRLKIVTIDALCAYIVTKMPILSHIGAMPEVVDNPTHLFDEAIDWLCSKTQHSDPWAEALAHLYWHFDNRLPKIQKCFRGMLSKRDQWLPFLNQLNDDQTILQTSFARSLTRLIEGHLQKLHESLDTASWHAITALLRQAAEVAKVVDPGGAIAQCVDCPDALEPKQSTRNYWRGLRSLLLTQSGQWRKRWTEKEGFPPKSRGKTAQEKAIFEANKNAIADLVYELADNENFRVLLDEYHYLPQATLGEEQSDLLFALGTLLRVLIGSLQLVFQQKGQVDFTEMALRALEALGQDDAPTDIALFLDYRLKHILIDEYQDTSVIQNRLFEKLVSQWQPSDYRTLFLVGDPMQSIYRFRGAEVSLFITTQQKGLGPIRLTPLQLTQNFRSDPQLITWINERFKNLFPKRPDPALGAVPFASAEPTRDSQPNGGIYCHPIDVRKENHEDKLLSMIQNAHEHAPNDYSIAVLARTKKHLMHLVSQLKALSLPFIAYEIDRFSQRPHVMDYMTLFAALCDLSDRVAWYAFLRSPFVGLPLGDLLVVHQHDTSSLIWFNLQAFDTLGLSQSGHERLQAVIPLVDYWLRHQGRHHRHQWLRGLWVALGGLAIYGEKWMQEDLDKVDTFIQQFAHCDISVALPLIQSKVASASLDSQVRPVRNNAHKKPIELMTIHKAKGLEFDEVFIPYMHLGTRRDEPGLLEWTESHHEDGMDILFAGQRAHQAASDDLYDFVRRQIAKKQQVESIRLLYVALTRARLKCHLLGDCVVDPEKGYIKPPAQSFWGLITNPEEIEQQIEVSALATPIHESLQEMENPSLQPDLFRLPSHWQPPRLLSEKFSQFLATSDLDEDLNHPELGDVHARVMGTVFHRVMQYYGTRLLTLDNPWQTLEKSVRLSLKRFGLQGEALEGASGLIRRGIQNLIQDKTGMWILDPTHQNRHSEWALSYRNGKKVVQIILDWFFVDQQQTAWIIDFKMTQADLNQPALLDAEIMQYLPQLKQYQRAVSQLGFETVRTGLYFPLMPKWCEL